MSLQNAVDLTAAEPAADQKEKPKIQPKVDKAKPKKATVIDETKDTEAERLLKARKVAINRLFDKVNLKPVFADEITKKHKKKGKMDSKRALLEHYDGTEQKLKEKKKEISKPKAKDAKGKGKAKAEEDEEAADEMSENQVNEVFAKAVKNDANLPEMDPPATFALKLR
jgi:DNA repair protein RAD5